MKGKGYGGKRYISIPGFQGYVTRKLNPERRELKRQQREAFWTRENERNQMHQSGLSTVVRSSPCLIPESGRAAQARQHAASWSESEEQRIRNRCQTRIRGSRNLKKKLVSEFGSLHAALEDCVANDREVAAKEA